MIPRFNTLALLLLLSGIPNLSSVAAVVAPAAAGRAAWSVPFPPASYQTLAGIQRLWYSPHTGKRLQSALPSFEPLARVGPDSRELAALGALARHLPADFDLRVRRAVATDYEISQRNELTDIIAAAYERAIPEAEAAIAARAAEVIEGVAQGRLGADDLAVAAHELRPFSIYGWTVRRHVRRVSGLASLVHRKRTMAAAQDLARRLQSRPIVVESAIGEGMPGTGRGPARVFPPGWRLQRPAQTSETGLSETRSTPPVPTFEVVRQQKADAITAAIAELIIAPAAVTSLAAIAFAAWPLASLGIAGIAVGTPLILLAYPILRASAVTRNAVEAFRRAPHLPTDPARQSWTEQGRSAAARLAHALTSRWLEVGWISLGAGAALGTAAYLASGGLVLASALGFLMGFAVTHFPMYLISTLSGAAMAMLYALSRLRSAWSRRRSTVSDGR